MEEKILFKVKTHKFILFFRLMVILFLMGAISLCTVWFYEELHGLDWMYEHKHDEYCAQTFDDELLFKEGDYLATNDQYHSFHEFIEVEYAKLPDKEYHDEYIDCDILVYGGVDAAIDYIYSEYDTPLEDYIYNCANCLMIALIPYILIILPIKSQRSKFVVTEYNLHGKKGCRKFNISFTDIIEITQKGKSITIKTEKKKLKLSSLKNCDEIYNHIKPYVPEKTISQQATSTVDDIKLF